MRKYYFQGIFYLMVALLTSCVPARKLEESQAMNQKLINENSNLNKELSESRESLNDANKRLDQLTSDLGKLASDTAFLGEKYRKANSMNKEINALYEQAIQQNELLLSKSSAEKLALIDSLKRKQQELFSKEKELDSIQQSLLVREKKLEELQSLLTKKDSAASALKTQLAKALLGFEKSDLTVEQRNGKVYVSMAEKLLFKSGSTAVDPKGRDALQKLAEVLKQNPDLNIEVEGHTDNVPLAGTGAVKDNWDLSVLRATSIIRILTESGVDPKQITASGRGEYFPVASNASSEGKSKNRRTEIILSPRLDELMKIIGDQ